MKKNTRKQKQIKNGDKPQGASKYAQKVAKRQKRARDMGMPINTPAPVPNQPEK